jgi:uncharacterized protein (DUF2267 family)
MSQTGLSVFDSTLHATNVWLKELMQEMGWDDRQKAYHALREVLHALRDRLPVGEAAALAAQLPLLVRGVFYEGWHPAGKPFEHHKDAFLARLADAFRGCGPAGAEQIARAVFRVLARHVSHGETQHVRRALPADFRALWAGQPAGEQP